MVSVAKSFDAPIKVYIEYKVYKMIHHVKGCKHACKMTYHLSKFVNTFFHCSFFSQQQMHCDRIPCWDLGTLLYQVCAFDESSIFLLYMCESQLIKHRLHN